MSGGGIRLFLGLFFIFILVVSLGASLASAFMPDGTICFGNQGACVYSASLNTFLAVAGLSGLLAIVFFRGTDGGAVSGAGVVFAGVIAALALTPEVHVNGYVAPAAHDAETGGGELASRMLRTIQRARTIEFQENFTYANDSVQLINGGLAAFRFVIKPEDGPQRLLIDVMVQQGDEDGDPMIELFAEHDDDTRDRLSRDDNGGSEQNARIERELEPGTYILTIRDSSYNPILSAEQKVFRLSIKPYSLDNIVSSDRTFTLVLGEEGGCVERSSCDLRVNEVKARAAVEDDDFFRVDLQTFDNDACLVVDVDPEGDSDTLLGIFDANREFIVSNDDWREEDQSSRAVLPVESGTQTLLIHVTSFSSDTKYSLYTEIRPREADGSCISVENFERPELEAQNAN